MLQQLGPASSDFVRCCGVHVGKADLCLRHAVLFDHWHAFEGGEAIYAGDLSREQKRDEHRSWLRTRTKAQLTQVLKVRHAFIEEAV